MLPPFSLCAERTVYPLPSLITAASSLLRCCCGCSRRYLVEAPPNICKPAHLARAAEAIAAGAPDVMACKILEREACAEMGMGCYLGVAECSDAPPKFIHLTYTPPGARSAPCATLPQLHCADLICHALHGMRTPPLILPQVLHAHFIRQSFHGMRRM